MLIEALKMIIRYKMIIATVGVYFPWNIHGEVFKFPRCREREGIVGRMKGICKDTSVWQGTVE